ncbi:hypothetical protein ANANG_G00286340 [Anguilla anguilla]|uniref:Uncharacterized protein n=1 Tax=Anguilla anguilla TaxID=7936 RepID=A0A9D3RLC6_ANGAN|nr:hypothetical protein ANANG_G00286340 [Anguilla anguilla]
MKLFLTDQRLQKKKLKARAVPAGERERHGDEEGIAVETRRAQPWTPQSPGTGEAQSQGGRLRTALQGGPGAVRCSHLSVPRRKER